MSSIFIAMLNNAALLIMLSLLYDMPGIRTKGPQTTFFRQAFIGFITGLVGIAVMLNPMHFGQGVVFDTRSVLLSISGLFFGTVPVILAVIMTAAFRLFMGGIGAWTGVAVIVTSGGLGLIWRYLHRDTKGGITTGGLYLMGIAVHGAMLLWMLSLPLQIAKEVLYTISLPVLLIFPTTTVVLGWVMKNRSLRQRAEENLRQSQARYEKAQEMGKVGNWEYNLKTAEFWGSDEAKKIYGFAMDKDSFSTEEVESCIIERERVHQALVDLIENRKPYNLEFDIITKNTGKIKTLVSIAEIETDGAKNPVKISGVIHDITERKNAENSLENERRFLTAVFDNIEEAIVICDENGALVRFNEAARKLHGLPEQTIKPEQWTEYYNLFRKDGITPLPVEEIPLYRALQGEHVRDAEIVVASRNNMPRYLVCNGQNLADDTGRIIGAVVAMHDDTRRRMAEMEHKKLHAQLSQAQKMESVGRLAGGVAHDFNNMLGVILGYTELALLKTDKNNDLYSDLKEIQTAAQRSADITKQLLAFARKQTISPRQLDLNDTVESMLNMLRRLIGEDIDLVWQPSAHLWPVKMDPSQIDQILANLCINARDAIGGVGKLTIETGKKTFDEAYCKEYPGFIPGDFVLLAVSDNGCGMHKDTLDNLFEPFFTTKEIGKGTGLGLATIYGIVKQNNGFINVYSESGQGSTFKIYLPRLVADKDVDKVAPKKKAAAGGTETILLVEDEPAILKMTKMMLERKHYTVLSVATPSEALRKAKKHSGPIDLLMTDVVMPEMNGRDLAGEIFDLYPDIRILFMSGYTANVIAHHGILDDGVAFIQKPFSMADMTLTVRAVLDKRSDGTQE